MPVPTNENDNRWLKRESYAPGWNKRTEIIASLIRPGESVLELGCGLMWLRQCLPPGCIYTPSDMTDIHGAEMIIDLNAPVLPEIQFYDVAVMGGVLEYIHDVPKIIHWLSARIKALIFSYATYNRFYSFEDKFRSSHGWD